MLLSPIRTLVIPMLGGLICAMAAPSICASGTKVHLSQLEHSTWRLQDGVFTGAPRGIAQTKDGYLWIGTVGGSFVLTVSALSRGSRRKNRPRDHWS